MEPTKRRLRVLGLLLALTLPISSCGTSGEECDRCTTDADCTGGLFCSTFDDGSMRCGTGMGTTCRVR